jgi:hypothetical protein
VLFGFLENVKSGVEHHVSIQDAWVQLVKDESTLSSLEAMTLYSWLNPEFMVTFLFCSYNSPKKKLKTLIFSKFLLFLRNHYPNPKRSNKFYLGGMGE